MNFEFANLFRLFRCCFLFLLLASFDYGQSGRIPSLPPENPADEISQPDGKSSAVKPVCPNTDEIEYVAPKHIPDFIAELNKNGVCGYKLEKVVPLSTFGKDDDKTNKINLINLAGIIAHDARNEFEYQWFVAEQTADLELRLATWSKSGFYFHSAVPYLEIGELYSSRTSDDENAKANASLFEMPEIRGNIILLERKIGVAETPKYKIPAASIFPFKRPLKDLQVKVNELVTQGYSPVAALFSFNGYSSVPLQYYSLIFRENAELRNSAENENKPAPVGKECAFIYGRRFILKYNTKKKISEWSKKGFKIVSVRDEVAVMCKATADAKPISYQFLNANDKKFQEKMSSVIAKGGKFIAVGQVDAGDDLLSSLLIFEQSDSAVQTKEYVTLKLTEARYKATLIPNYDPVPLITSEEAIANLKKLLKDGYKISDLYFANRNVNVLLERPKP